MALRPTDSLGIDVDVRRLLDEWAPAIGAPTCGPGCSACCERMTVVATSAEALRLLDLLDADPGAAGIGAERAVRMERLESALSALVSADAAKNHLLDLGPCVFLNERGDCGVYEARPDACRACYVWHEARFCGREDYDMCAPAELNALRVDKAYERMLAEYGARRKPFWGFLLPVVWLAEQRREDYFRGADLSQELDAAWIDTELIEFPSREELERERVENARMFAEEESPMGFPRATRAKNRAFLDAFALDA